MLHANMMPLLSQVYNGKIASSKTKLDEYGGQKMDAHIVEGIKIAAIGAVSACCASIRLLKVAHKLHIA